MRLDGYIRVSRVAGREGDSFISPTLQRERCDGAAKAGGHTIVTWHEDLDQPGSKAGRPGFQAALARVESGETDGIVVARLDRFARSVADAAAALRRINDADGALLSAQESLDTSTSFGRFALQMMFALAELELDRLRESWDAARASAVARGVHVASRTPTGYRRKPDRTLEPDPETAPAIAKVFEARGDGASWRELGAILEEAGVKTPYGAPSWTNRSLTHLISNRVYLGEARSGEHFLPDAHDAIVSRHVWNLAQRPRGKRSVSSGGALMSGLLRCAGCQYVLKPDYMTDRDGSKLRLYRCRGARAAGRCPKPASVLGRVIEPWVEEQFFDGLGDVLAEAVRATEHVVDAEEELKVAEEELDAYIEADIADVVGIARYREGLVRRQRRFDDAQVKLSQVRAEADGPGLPPEATLRAMWPSLSVKEQRQLLSLGIDAIFLRSLGRTGSVPIDDRALILWKGEASDDLPGPGRRVETIRSFDWPS